MKAYEFLIENAVEEDIIGPAELKRQAVELEKQIDVLASLVKQAREITTEIKYDDTVRGILSRIQELAEKIETDPRDLKYAFDEVYEANNALESAIYNLDNIFTEKLTDLESKLEEINWELDNPDESIQTEGKKGRRAMRYNKKPRDPNHSTLAAKRSSGAGGAHRDKRKEEKQGLVKHKKDLKADESMLPHSTFAGSKVGQKEGPAGQWRNKGPKANKPAKKGDLVGSSS